jgi:hypothetical protein
MVAAAACGEPDTRIATKFASDFTPARRSISVLGVYKDGQMSAEAWDSIAPKVAPSLGGDTCVLGYSEALQTTNAPLSSAIDDYARSNGPTDDLLVQLAPAAKGDLVVVFTFAGKLPAPKSKDLVGAAAANASGSAMGGGGAGGGGGYGPGGSGPGAGAGAGGRRGARMGPRAAPADPNELDISASIFSVAQGRSVGLVAMRYSGASVDEAMTAFSAELARALPQARCDGWDWSAKIDAEHVRQTIDQ